MLAAIGMDFCRQLVPVSVCGRKNIHTRKIPGCFCAAGSGSITAIGLRSFIWDFCLKCAILVNGYAPVAGPGHHDGQNMALGRADPKKRRISVAGTSPGTLNVKSLSLCPRPGLFVKLSPPLAFIIINLIGGSGLQQRLCFCA